ncbi:sensor histidine kinase [Spongiimicrobium salis]|uniref:sensor histidine kinase n=1 Tax=Spongiimicrobium salis TaxID=1667022 RepID=UPI00374D514E
MNRRKITITVLLIPFALFGQTITSERDFIIDALIGFHFSQARISIDKLPTEKERLEFKTLYTIIYNAGRDRENDSISINTLDKLSLNTTNKVVPLLSKAYFHLFNNRNDTISFKYFDEAYTLSKKQKSRSLNKLSILGFLHLYGKEIVLSSNAFMHYLDEYRLLSTTIDDRAWLAYYKNYFTLSILDDNEKYRKTSRNLIAFLKKNTLSEALDSYFYKDIGLYYKALGVKDSAKFYFKKVLDLPDLPIIQNKKYNALLYLADINGSEKQFKKSDEYLKLSKKDKEKVDPLLADFNFERFKALYHYEHMSKFDSAYWFLKRSIVTEAQLGIRTNRLHISRLNVQLRTSEKENKILVQKGQIEKEKRQKRVLFFGVVIFLVLGSFISVLLFKNTTKKRKLAEQKALLEQQKTETLLREQELMSIDAMISGQEKERQRVANELHDDLGSKMATIKLHLENIKTDKEDPSYRHTSRLLEEAYQRIRSISHVKNSGVITKQGLLPAVQRMAKTISETNKIQLAVNDFGLENRMENSLELNTFRIIQELVTNIIKHANATKGSIQLTQHEESLNILVEDNGKGFEPKNIKSNSSSIGLRNIEKRIEHLNGNFTIDSTLGKGTSIIIDIPI